MKTLACAGCSVCSSVTTSPHIVWCYFFARPLKTDSLSAAAAAWNFSGLGPLAWLLVAVWGLASEVSRRNQSGLSANYHNEWRWVDGIFVTCVRCLRQSPRVVGCSKFSTPDRRKMNYFSLLMIIFIVAERTLASSVDVDNVPGNCVKWYCVRGFNSHFGRC